MDRPAQITKGDLDTVTFDPIASWKSGEDGKITYTLPSSLQHNSYQWIAIFRVCVFRDSTDDVIITVCITQGKFFELR